LEAAQTDLGTAKTELRKALDAVVEATYTPLQGFSQEELAFLNAEAGQAAEYQEKANHQASEYALEQTKVLQFEAEMQEKDASLLEARAMADKDNDELKARIAELEETLPVMDEVIGVLTQQATLEEDEVPAKDSAAMMLLETGAVAKGSSRSWLRANFSNAVVAAVGPASSEVIGYLKNMKDTMEKEYAEAKKTQEEKNEQYGKVISAMQKDRAAAKESYDTASERLLEAAVARRAASDALALTQKLEAQDRDLSNMLVKLNTDAEKQLTAVPALATRTNEELAEAERLLQATLDGGVAAQDATGGANAAAAAAATAALVTKHSTSGNWKKNEQQRKLVFLSPWTAVAKTAAAPLPTKRKEDHKLLPHQHPPRLPSPQRRSLHSPRAAHRKRHKKSSGTASTAAAAAALRTGGNLLKSKAMERLANDLLHHGRFQDVQVLKQLRSSLRSRAAKRIAEDVDEEQTCATKKAAKAAERKQALSEHKDLMIQKADVSGEVASSKEQLTIYEERTGGLSSAEDGLETARAGFDKPTELDTAATDGKIDSALTAVRTYLDSFGGDAATRAPTEANALPTSLVKAREELAQAKDEVGAMVAKTKEGLDRLGSEISTLLSEADKGISTLKENRDKEQAKLDKDGELTTKIADVEQRIETAQADLDTLNKECEDEVTKEEKAASFVKVEQRMIEVALEALGAEKVKD